MVTALYQPFWEHKYLTALLQTALTSVLLSSYRPVKSFVTLTAGLWTDRIYPVPAGYPASISGSGPVSENLAGYLFFKCISKILKCILIFFVQSFDLNPWKIIFMGPFTYYASKFLDFYPLHQQLSALSDALHLKYVSICQTQRGGLDSKIVYRGVVADLVNRKKYFQLIMVGVA